MTFGFQVVESSSLVSVLFREAFSHPYIIYKELKLHKNDRDTPKIPIVKVVQRYFTDKAYSY